METVNTSETSINFCQTTNHNISQDSRLQFHPIFQDWNTLWTDACMKTCKECVCNQKVKYTTRGISVSAFSFLIRPRVNWITDDEVKSKSTHHTSLWVPHVVTSAVGKWNAWGWGGFQWHNVRAKFRVNRPTGSNTERTACWQTHAHI